MFDMGMGMGMMDAGMVDMEIGAMEMDMGMGMAGMGMMEMGAMEMGMGAGLMNMGAMEMDMGMMGGMGMGYGMGGMGMGMGVGMGVGMMGMNRGIGYCPVGCMQPCCRVVTTCPPNCMLACCRPNNMRICIPGCTGPCCQNQTTVIRQAPYSNNYVNPPRPAYNQQYQQEQQINREREIAREREMGREREMMREQQMRDRERQQREEEMRLQQEKMQLQRQQMQMQAQMQTQQMEQQRIEQQRQEQRRIEQQRAEQQRMERMRAEQYQNNARMQSAKDFAVESRDNNPYPSLQTQSNSNPYQAQSQVLYEGDIYCLTSGWNLVRNAQLTASTFMQTKITNITKMKVKLESCMNNTRMIKLTTTSGDLFFSVFAQEQAEWMARLTWAKLATIGHIANLTEPYHGHIEGPVLKKGFFSGWEGRYASVSTSGLKISKQMGGAGEQIVAVPQIWTRFQIINGHLIVKMRELGRKHEIGVPIGQCMSWLKGLYTLIRP